MRKILVSACLLGEKVRYDGGDCRQDGTIRQWLDEERVVGFCPEVAGGLPVPRPPAEIVDALHGLVRCCDGQDVTAAFKAGAESALSLCRGMDIRIAILKEGSPSCGSGRINDGSFSGTKITGQGITAALLRRQGIHVFSERQLSEAAACLKLIEGGGREE